MSPQQKPQRAAHDSYTPAPSASCRGAGQALGQQAQSSKMQLFQAPSHLHMRGSPLKTLSHTIKGKRDL